MHDGDGGPSQGTYGVFQQGNGNGSWFVRVAGTPDTVIHHDAVTHEEPNPLFPCAPPPPPPPPPPVDCEPDCPPPTEPPPTTPGDVDDPQCVVRIGTEVVDCDDTFVPTGAFGDPPPPADELAHTGMNAWLAVIGAALIAAGYGVIRLSRRFV